MKRFGILLTGILALGYLISCTTSSKVKSGQEAFELKKYALAIPLLESEFEKSKDMQTKSEIAFMIANSLDKQNKFREAEKWYKVYRDHSADQQAGLVYGKALMRVEKYAEAQKVLEQYLRVNRQDRREVEPLIKTCEHVLKYGEDEKKFSEIEKLPFNSAYADFDAFPQGDSFIFSSTRLKPAAPENEWNREGFSSLWQADRKGREAKEFDFISNGYHIASYTATADGKTVYYTQCGTPLLTGEDFCAIYRTVRENDDWTAPKKIFLFGDSANHGTPFITPDGKVLYFSSDAPYGYGGKDLYFINILNDSSYSVPLNLGSRVNTPGDEMYPFVTEDGHTLFYSSNQGSYGGLDIFRASKAGRMFVNPQRLPYGVNSGGDDFALKLFYEPNEDTTLAFRGIFTSNRNAENDNLYIVELKHVEPVELPPALLLLEGQTVENIYADSLNPNSEVLGQKPVPNPKITLGGELTPADEEGFYTAQLDSGLSYQVIVQKEGYLSADLRFNTLNIESKPGDTIYFRQKIVLSRIIKDVEIVLDNIYYDFDKWDIRDDARPTLDSLSNILKQNPKIEIELASHTDCRGNDAYNMDLSQKRAESVVQYLIDKGIESARLKAKGYGASMPLEFCECNRCTEEQHQRNRRTSFKIL